MKFDKRKISHWLYLILSLIFAHIGAALRRAGLIKRTNLVIFYGHVLNGNLKVFYELLEQGNDFEPVFMTMFPEYQRQLQRQDLHVLLACSLTDALKIAGAGAVITDHGSHFLYPAYKNSGIGFFDVWHGIPYKGWDGTSFGEQKFYDEIWVSSKHFVDIYRQQYKFHNPIIATGYARTDPLIKGEFTKEKLIKKYRLPQGYRHLILVAPTWKQDSNNRSIIPFNETLRGFFSKLNEIGKSNNSLVIFRAHLNSGDTINMDKYKNVVVMPYAKYPVAEEFVGAADLVVSDWSSIVFDFMVLGRPVVYLDVEAPFEKGFTLDGSYRFGPVVSSMAELSAAITQYVGQPQKYQKDFRKVLTKTEKVAYGGLADGQAAQRYLKRLKLFLNNNHVKK
jgi:CDP-glycerol glycerophosphotransferase